MEVDGGPVGWVLPQGGEVVGPVFPVGPDGSVEPVFLVVVVAV